MNLIEKQLKKETIYRGKIINMRRDIALLPDGNEAVREIVEHPGGVCVSALTDNDEVLMVRQFRYPYSEVIYEIPAGKRNHPKEDPLICGMRELKEETGATAEQFIFLGRMYPTPGYCNEVIFMYGAKNLHFGDSDPDADEFLECEKIPFDTVVDKIMNGEITDAKTISAILKIKLLRDRGEF